MEQILVKIQSPFVSALKLVLCHWDLFLPYIVANLLNSNKKSLYLLGQEQDSVVYKNKITFRFQGRYDVVLISRARYCEFRVSRALGAVEDKEFCCPLIKDMLQNSIKDVIDRMRQNSLFQLSQGYDFAFKCPQSKCKKRTGNESLVVLNLGDLETLNCERWVFNRSRNIRYG